MLKLFSNMLDAICSVVAVIILIALTVLGVFLGLYFCDYFAIEAASKVLLSIGFGFVGLVIGFVGDTLAFGLIANIIEIRKNLEKLNENK